MASVCQVWIKDRVHILTVTVVDLVECSSKSMYDLREEFSDHLLRVVASSRKKSSALFFGRGEEDSCFSVVNVLLLAIWDLSGSHKSK